MELPSTNQKVELRILHGPFASTYTTYVEVAEADGVTVVHPSVGGKLVPLAPGDTVRLEYAVMGLARVSFAARITRVLGGQVPLVTVGLPEKNQVERFQQRDFVRLDVELKLLYYVVSTPDGAARPGGVFRSHTRDISGNGIQILCPEPYPPGTQLDIHLEVGDRVVHAVGEVIRQVQQLSAREYWMGVRFVGLDERDRDMIIRFIFSEQRDRRRRGLL
ncbi:MAG TPA: PilZ domain-containing protein [Symbiobacteriaceae bacterium]|nr:PilZ domain-containing protein [Symbiobacteriaceae bacterium]